jgi:hypothetical protein
VLALGAALAIVGFVVVKMDLFGHAKSRAAGVSAVSYPVAEPGAVPIAAPAAAPGAAQPQFATQAASATAEPAGAGAGEQPAAEPVGTAAARPRVVALPDNAAPTPVAVPAANPVVHRRTPRRHRPTASALPPELAAEEALLSGGPRIERAPKKTSKRAKSPTPQDQDPWAE